MKQMNHTEYPKSLKKLANEALKFRIKDATEAINAMPDNPNNSYYADEIHYCVAELNRRKGEVISEFESLFDNVTRFEVISRQAGRLIVRDNIELSLSLQDNRQTLKIFIP